MKSIAKILLTTIVIMFSSCQERDTSKAKLIEKDITQPTAHRFTFDGHSYISFKYVTRNSVTTIHDPDCICNKKN